MVPEAGKAKAYHQEGKRERMAGTDKDEYASTGTMRRNTARDGQEHQGLHGYTTAELLDLVREGLTSGPGRHAAMASIKDEARRRHGAGPP
jgi:hypothetical protein